MQKILLFCTLLLSVFVGNCQNKRPLKRPTGPELAVRWQLIQSAEANRFEAKFTLVNQGKDTLPSRGWTIYFNQISGSPQPNRGKVSVQKITGDYYKLQPIAGFSKVAPGDSTIFTVNYQGSLRKYTHGPHGMYIVFENNNIGNEQAPEALTNVTILPLPNDNQMVYRNNPPVPLATWYYNRNAEMITLADTDVPKIIPTPVQLKSTNQTFIINKNWRIRFEKSLQKEANYLALLLEQSLAAKIQTEESITGDKEAIILKINSQLTQPESYRLTASAANGILIEGKDAAGVFYGIQSLLAWLPPTSFKNGQNILTINEVQIEDAPRFGYRGIHLDVARNFNKKETVLKLLDVMGFYKLNKLHFHVADDEGWRLEIPALPELTQVGARRGHTRTESDRIYPAYGSGPFVDAKDSYGSGYYTSADFIEILRKATSRHIEVIVEFDTPGHSRAAIKAMQNRYNRLMAAGKKAEAEAYLLHDPKDASKYNSAQGYSDNVLCICKEAPYRLWETVIDEVQKLYAAADAPLKTIHIGGDEVPSGSWEKSPICAAFRAKNPQYKTIEDLQHYFLRRVNNMLTKRGLKTGGWEEIVLKKEGNRYVPNPEFAGKNLQAWVWISAWDSDGLVYRMANAGFPVVVCNVPNFYFDLAYNPEAREPGLSWGGFVGNREPYAYMPENAFVSEDFSGFTKDMNQAAKMEALTPKGLQNILGLQGQLWSETIHGQDELEYLLLPKLFGLAERAWSPQPAWAKMNNATQRAAALDTAWNAFANTIGQRDLPRLDYLFNGYHYRIAPPGAVVENGLLKANTEFPNQQIHYTTDGTEPTINSTLYEKTVQVNGMVKLKAFDTRGRGSRTSVVQ